VEDDSNREQDKAPVPSSSALSEPVNCEIEPEAVDPEWLSMKLDSWLLKGIVEQGFTKPTPIQSQSIPFALDGRDVIGVAQTVCLPQTPLATLH
jgi:superfamily II DNA/RNA helicase